MIRYRLDDLGAYQFEKLAQSLLKAQVSLSIESWGNRRDFGRDAYTTNKLRFPDKDDVANGPFLFQVKFVEGANAAGASPKEALLNSVNKEITAIKERASARRWIDPAYFTFMTNSLISSEVRERIREKLLAVLPTSTIVMWGGDDVCDLLDQAPYVSRSFPQLLSIRDLDALIHRALSNESIVRSATAIESARELVPIFVPTLNYEKAWQTLRKHHFAVLQGPPEVGKSAIAWMIGMSQVGIGWEAIYSRTPEAFFEMYDHTKEQAFIADDAFGRTEYDPARTSSWEAQLDLVLHRLDVKHWLIWTSRKHILERAVARMDVQGKARSFPNPGAVLIDVQSLSVEEAEMLSVFEAARAEAESSGSSDDPEDLRALASNLSQFANTLETISSMSSKLESSAFDHSTKLSERASELEDEAANLDQPEPDYDRDDYSRSSDETFDIKGLFSEL
jgi:hypothetical protein